MNAWRDRTDNAVAQDQTYTDARDTMLEAETSALNAFSDYQKYQSIESNQSNLDYYQGLIDNAADGVDTTSWQSSVDYYQGRIDNIQATMSSQAGNSYTDSDSAAQFFDQQRDA
ncbi:pilin, partial [Francisella philomiragia]